MTERCINTGFVAGIKGLNGALVAQLALSKKSSLGTGIEDFSGEKNYQQSKYLIHRYSDRAVILATNQCFYYCAFCFRKDLWRDGPWAINDFGLELVNNYLRAHPEIKEVIISGGDPLTLSNQELGKIISKLASINHLQFFRLASRALSFYPARIDSGLIRLLRGSEKQVWFISHFNHPEELSKDSKESIKRLIDSGIPVLNQTVLLKGINDDEHILVELFGKLCQLGVKPYYIFQCDPVSGAENFCTELKFSLALMEKLSKYSGIILPKFALELPGYGKLSPGSGWQIVPKTLYYEVKSPEGKKYKYPRLMKRGAKC